MPNLAMPTGVSLDHTTASASDIFKNKTAYDGEGNLLTGTMINRGDSRNAGGDVGLYLNSSYPGIAVSLTDAAYFTINSDGVNRFCMQAVKGAYGLGTNLGYIGVDASTFGNASASDVRPGVTFTSQNGLKLTGTMDINASLKTTTLQFYTAGYDSPVVRYAPGPIVGVKSMWRSGNDSNKPTQFSFSGNSMSVYWDLEGMINVFFTVAYL